jgi:hypothetical protein
LIKKTGCMQEGNIKMGLKVKVLLLPLYACMAYIETSLPFLLLAESMEVVDWICIYRYKGHWRTTVHTVMTLRVP